VRAWNSGLSRPLCCERPLVQAVGAEEIEASADGDGDCTVEFEELSFCLGAARIEEHEGEAGHGNERRERVEGNAEGAREIGRRMRSRMTPICCRKNCSRMRVMTSMVMTCVSEKKQKKRRRGRERRASGGECRARVHGGEKAEVVAVAGGGVGDARVAELQREDAGEGGPDDEGGDQVAGPAAEGGAGDVGDELHAKGGGLGCVRCGSR
jgi:hypothetical protein